MKVLKRNGKVESFSKEKFYDSIRKAANAIGKKISDEELEKIKFPYGETVSVENILDHIIKSLYNNDLSDIADSFSMYRERRCKERDVTKKLFSSLEDVSLKSSKDVNLKRENANIDGDTAMGQMLRFGSESAKALYLSRVIDPVFADAHLNGDIHIHDLDFYAMTTTCCQIDVEKLLETGFNTGHGSVRPPKSIKTAANLACIVIQANQNDQHGGQSIPNFDRALAKYVDLECRNKYLETLSNMVLGASDILVKSKYLDWAKNNEDKFIDIVYDSSKCLDKTNKNRQDEAAFLMETGLFSIDEVLDWQDKSYKESVRYADKQTYQAMEAVVHNLNTLHSRCGSQVPFSSINFGTDTSESGRCVAKNLILAQEAGMGNGETPIFPILIYRLKDGINAKKGDKNYDIFKLAIRCSAKRMFPNFSFQDSVFNLQYYDPSRPETEITYMGAVLGSSVITIKYNDTIETLSFEDAYGKYCDKDNVYIYDSNSNGFVLIKNWINNPDGGDWYKLKFTNGRTIVLTSDHPLPTSRGRIECKDLLIGDIVPFAKYNNICDNNIVPELDPWIFGKSICYSEYEGSLPSDFLSWSYDSRIKLLAGIVDANECIDNNKEYIVKISSTNKTLAIEEMILAESLGFKASLSEDNSNNKYIVAFKSPKKLSEVCKEDIKPNVENSCLITSIEFLGSLNERRYDVETESDRFDVDGLNSHNCRTRVIGNAADKDRQISYSRGNLSFTTINLPRLAIEYVNHNGKINNKKDLESFKNDYVRPKLELVKNQLLERYKLQCSRTPKNFPFLMQQGVWLDSEKLGINDKLDDVLKHGTLSIGFIGLAETLKMLLGKHHGEDDFAQTVGLDIIKFMREFTDNATKEMNLNFTLLATPAEGLCLGGNTLVQTLSGNVPIKNINPGDYVLSYNEELHKTEVDRVIKVGKTDKKAKVVRVTFDTGQEIICTPEHEFGVRKRYKDHHGRATKIGGFSEYVSWRKACELSPGDRVKSCYLRLHRDGYLLQRSEGRYVHKFAYEDVFGVIPMGMHVHHKDGNKLNNHPDNLVCITELEHKRYHGAKNIKEYRFKKGEVGGSDNPFYGRHFTDEMKERQRRTKSDMKKLSQLNDEELLTEYRKGGLTRELSEKYGVTEKSYKKWISKLLDLEDLKRQELNPAEHNHIVRSVEFIKSRVAVYDITTEKNHNFFVGGNEGILVHNSGRFIRMDKKKYGIIEGVTDKEYYTNSFHIPVYYNIKAFEKIDKEAPYHELTNAGHISYVELNGNTSNNLEAFEKIILYMKEKGIGYGAINHPIDSDPECGYNGFIENECPKCHRHESKEKPFERLRRITGYLVGTLDRFNNAKRAEEADRVKHE